MRVCVGWCAVLVWRLGSNVSTGSRGAGGLYGRCGQAASCGDDGQVAGRRAASLLCCRARSRDPWCVWCWGWYGQWARALGLGSCVGGGKGATLTKAINDGYGRTGGRDAARYKQEAAGGWRRRALAVFIKPPPAPSPLWMAVRWLGATGRGSRRSMATSTAAALPSGAGNNFELGPGVEGHAVTLLSRRGCWLSTRYTIHSNTSDPGSVHPSLLAARGTSGCAQVCPAAPPPLLARRPQRCALCPPTWRATSMPPAMANLSTAS